MTPQTSEAADTAESRPLVSVIVPVLNGAEHLRESLDSILGQTYPRLELIVVDDGSTDATPEIIASYGDRVRSLRQPSTRGIYGNANDGIALASGDLIGVFHADDVYLPRMVEREVAWLDQHPKAGAVFCSDVFIDGEGREIGRLELPSELRGGRPLDYSTVLNALLRHRNVFLRCPTALVRASVYREVGVYRDAEFKNTSDMEMWLRMARHCPIGVLEDHLLLYRRGHGSSSERYHRLRTEPDRFFRIMASELEAGGRTPAERDALRAFDAHRSVDIVLCAVNRYILGDSDDALRMLRTTSLFRLAASGQIQRYRMLALALGLHVILRLPRFSAVAKLFERHWHGPPPTPARQA